MNHDPRSAREYVQRLIAAISKCACIDPNDRSILPARYDASRTKCLIVRGFDVPGTIFANDSSACSPFALVHGGILRFRARVREIRNRPAREVAVEGYYRFQVDDLDTSGNPNQVGCFRYDRPEGQPRGDGWEHDLGDNPQHPHAHLHINYLTPGANDLRMPTGPVSPLLLFRAFDYWYNNTYKR